jgi:hypothetical protein
MFIETLPKKNCLAPEERNVLLGDQLFRSYRAWELLGSWFYKHLIPLEHKTKSDQKLGLDCCDFGDRTLAFKCF